MHDVPGSHWHEPTAGKRAGFGKFGRPKTPYDLFMEAEGIPVFRDIGVSKVQNLPLAPWKRLGGRGTYVQLYGTEGKSFIVKEYNEILAREGVANRMDPQFYDKNYKGELPKGV
jgi:hypothetical protein